MIIGSSFLHDPLWVQKIQHELYGECVWLIFKKARSRYFSAEDTLEIETELGQAAKLRSSFDHRTLQRMHDQIAADYRYRHMKIFQQRIKGAFIVKTGWGDYELTDDQYIRELWKEYIDMKIDDLFQAFPNLPKQILVATTYANPDKRGIEAEDSIMAIIDTINPCVNEYRDIVYLNKPPKNPWSIIAPYSKS